MKKDIVITDELVISKIYQLRGHKVMLDVDLAELYQVDTKRLNEQVRRNIERFPEDFMFQLTEDEWQILRSQFATSSWGGRRYAPFAFTEHGVLMLSSVLSSDRAIQVNIQIMRIYTKLKTVLIDHKDILLKLEKMEHAVNKHDENFEIVFSYLRELINPPNPSESTIGFKQQGE
jgi:hypothetical protein